MKVCLISSFFYPVKGGGENHMYYLAKNLVKKGHEVEVFVSDRARTGRLPLEEIIEGIKIKRFKTWFKFSFSGMFFPGLFKAVKKSDADIFHVHGYRHPFNFVNYFTKKPCIMTLHWPNYPSGLRSRWIEFLIRVFDKTIGKRLLKKYDKLFAVSGAEIPWIKGFGVDESKISLTPNGIPEDYLNKRKGEKFRKKIGVKKNETMVLCLSRIHKSKGFDQVIRIAKYFPKTKFVIAGIDAGFQDYLKSLSVNLSNIIFAGQLSEEEKLEAYAAADIFIHPSHYEAFGIVVLEAFSQGCCVLTSDRGGLPWVVGDCGLIFKDNDLTDLKEKLEVLLKDKKLRQEFSTKGKNKVKNFTWGKIVDEIERKYAELL